LSKNLESFYDHSDNCYDSNINSYPNNCDENINQNQNKVDRENGNPNRSKTNLNDFQLDIIYTNLNHIKIENEIISSSKLTEEINLCNLINIDEFDKVKINYFTCLVD